MNWYPLFLGVIVMLSIFVLWYYKREGFQDTSTSVPTDISNTIVPTDISNTIVPTDISNNTEISSNLTPSDALTTEQITLLQESLTKPLTDQQATFIQAAQNIPVDKRDPSDIGRQCDVLTNHLQGLSTSVLNYRNKGMWSNVQLTHSMMKAIDAQLRSLGC